MLILAAFAPELAPFSERYRKEARTVGVGLVTAAHATASLLAAHRPDSVLLVGSCGVYPRAQPAIGSVVVVERAILVDSGAVRGEAALPEPMVTRAQMHRTLVEPFAERGCVKVGAACTLGITTSDSLAHALAEQSGAEVENLEAFAVAQACAAAGVPCAALLGVTNVVGREGRTQWREHHADVAARVARAVESVLG